MKTQLSKTEVAWAIFHKLISSCEETLIPATTHALVIKLVGEDFV